MPEIPLCIYCNLPVLVDEQEYIIINKRNSHSSAWEYAHIACHETRAKVREGKPEDFAVPV